MKSSQDIQLGKEGTVIRKPLKVLVCLAIAITFTTVPVAWSYSGSGTPAPPSIEADALSVNSAPQPRIQVRPRSYTPVRVAKTRAYRYCPPPPMYPRYGMRPRLAPLFGLTSIPGLSWLSGFTCNSVLPRAGCKQFDLSAGLWYMRFNSSTQVWGTNGVGVPGTELDLHDNLDLGKFEYVPEYEASYQLRKNWAVRASFMPLNFKETSTIPAGGGFLWGYVNYPGGTVIETKYDRYIYRFDLVYSWFQARHAVSKIFAGYSLYDDRISIWAAALNQRRIRSVGYGLAFGGMSIERVIRDIGGGTVSIKTKGSVQFLEGYVGWDASAMGRLYVPMLCRRWGYMEAGWRWIGLRRDDVYFVDETNFDGLMVKAGMIF
jgi:hypothetical protein